MMHAPTIWYIIMNTNRARILRELPGPHDPLHAEITMQGRRRNMADIIADQPTSSFASAGGGRRSSVEPGSDPVGEDERVFIGELQDFLTKEAAAMAYDQLVVIATPDAMGKWRAQASPDLKRHVKQEIIRNLVAFSAHELVAAVRALVKL